MTAEEAAKKIMDLAENGPASNREDGEKMLLEMLVIIKQFVNWKQ